MNEREVKKSFVMYQSFVEAIRKLDKDEQLSMFWAICDYGLYKKEPAFSGVLDALWITIKPQLEANWMRYLNSFSGGAPLGNQNARKQPKNNQKQPNVNDNVNDNVNVGESKRERKIAFVPPSLEDIKDYIQEKGYDIDAGAFIDHYSAVGWMIGKIKMKDWQAAVRQWARREGKFDTGKAIPSKDSNKSITEKFNNLKDSSVW